MKTETTTENDFEATYCPEDNKLRLYVGRVPRAEYLKLRAEGWVALHKQRETGGGDFAATWTPSRRNTALRYAGFIGDEDKGPDERAADRAERFGGYRDKRTGEATGHADSFDAGPAAHGYQSAARAERAVARHDRIADRATDAWSKAEYWTQRTAGVISHALYKSSPGVRMGRIKTIEAEQRKHAADMAEYRKKWDAMKKLEAVSDPAEQTERVLAFVGAVHIWGEYQHPDDASQNTSLYCLMTTERNRKISGAESIALFFSDHSEPQAEDSWSRHYALRLAYENQMLSAQGGRLEQCEVLAGGKLGGRLILKVSKSNVTGRATSCDILGPKVSGWAYQVSNIPHTEFAAYHMDLERFSPDAYTPPTPESLAELAAFKKSCKEATPKKEACPLINPTDEDAERLQAVWNERSKADHEQSIRKMGYAQEVMNKWIAEFKPSTVCRIPQAVYSANSKGAYAKATTSALGYNCELQKTHYNSKKIVAVCQLRQTWGDGESRITNVAPARRVIVLTDKPQKPLPAAVWTQPQPTVELVNA